MTVWQAIVLGLVQGLGEFLPISSSAHLVLVPWIFCWRDPGLAFDVALHLGIVVAVVAYFWRDWLNLIAGAFRGTRTAEGKLFWWLVFASVPGALIGLLLEKNAETVFRAPPLIAAMLMIMGVLLYIADRRGAKKVKIEKTGLGRSLIIGFSQALAIIPGVSRSGITIATGLLAGLERESATRFSFLLSAPIIVGAGLVKVPELLHHPQMVNASFGIGVLVSAVSGFVSIGFLMRYIRMRSFLPFVWYRLLLGAFVLVLFFTR